MRSTASGIAKHIALIASLFVISLCFLAIGIWQMAHPAPHGGLEMTPAEAIMVLIYLAIVAIGAWFIQWCAENAFGSPLQQPVRVAIWGIAALLGLLILLGAFGGIDFDLPGRVDVD